MPAPQTLQDALNKVQDDADALSITKGDNDKAAADLATAQHVSDTANAAVQNAQAQLQADASALIQLIKTTYGVP